MAINNRSKFMFHVTEQKFALMNSEMKIRYFLQVSIWHVFCLGEEKNTLTPHF